jgi:hypothetical protein
MSRVERTAVQREAACRLCKFESYGACHRFPPQLSSVSTGAAFTYTDRKGVWPTVDGSDYCGEFKLALGYRDAGCTALAATDAPSQKGSK